jgi:hypothetical protein
MNMKGNMRHYTIHNFKHSEISLATILLAVLLHLSACKRQPLPAMAEEITFKSGELKLAGYLHLLEDRRGSVPGRPVRAWRCAKCEPHVTL